MPVHVNCIILTFHLDCLKKPVYTLFNNGKYRAIIVICLLVYIVALLWLTFFEVGTTDRNVYFSSREMHLIPFENTYQSVKLAIYNEFEPPHKAHYRYITFRNIFGNILLYVPWGILSQLIFPKLGTLKYLVATAFLISFSAEAAQYSLVLGIFDIDDIIFNITGAITGYFLLRFLVFYSIKRCKR